MGRPGFSPGKKLTGGKFRPVTPVLWVLNLKASFLYYELVFIEVTLRSSLFVCLFVLRLNVPVNNFSVMSGRSHHFLGN